MSKMSLRTCFGKLAKAIAYLIFFTSDAHHGELSLNEAEPDGQLLLIIRTQFELGRYYRPNKFLTDRLRLRGPGGDK
jgi:hypothetical protein